MDILPLPALQQSHIPSSTPMMDSMDAFFREIDGVFIPTVLPTIAKTCASGLLSRSPPPALGSVSLSASMAVPQDKQTQLDQDIGLEAFSLDDKTDMEQFSILQDEALLATPMLHPLSPAPTSSSPPTLSEFVRRHNAMSLSPGVVSQGQSQPRSSPVDASSYSISPPSTQAAFSIQWSGPADPDAPIPPIPIPPVVPPSKEGTKRVPNLPGMANLKRPCEVDSDEERDDDEYPECRKEQRSSTEELDEATLKRRKNAHAARKSRLKKYLQMERLSKQIHDLESVNSKLVLQNAVLDSQRREFQSRERALLQRIERLETLLKGSHTELGRQNSYSLNTLSTVMPLSPKEENRLGRLESGSPSSIKAEEGHSSSPQDQAIYISSKNDELMDQFLSY